MSFPRPRAYLIAVLGLPIVLGWAEASKPRPAPERIPPMKLRSPGIEAEPSDSASCGLGTVPPGITPLNFIFPPEQYYTLLTRSMCAECEVADTIWISAARVQLFFPVRCNLPVSVSIVGAGGPASCPTPDPSSILVPPAHFAVDTVDLVDLTLPLAAPFRMTRPAFLVVDFPPGGCADSVGNRSGVPRIMLAEGCRPCRSYNDYLEIDGVPEDMCSSVPPGERIGNPVMYVDVDSCFPFRDVTAPGAVADLAADSVGSTAVRLAWTAPGDDDHVGRAVSYELRRATFPLDPDNFATGQAVAGLPVPGTAGTAEKHLATGLDDGTTYYFALRARDEAANVGSISNVVEVTTRTAPARVLDLAVMSAGETSVTLEWTATGDSLNLRGPPQTYIVRASTDPLDPESFESAPTARQLVATREPGDRERLVFTGLLPAHRYWFALKAVSHGGIPSSLSNVVTDLTQLGPPLRGRAGPLIASRAQPARLPVEFLWQGLGTGARQSIRVYDALGSLRRVIPVGTDVWGLAVWDGRDDNGELLPSGIYFARLVGGGVGVGCRIVLLQ